MRRFSAIVLGVILAFFYVAIAFASDNVITPQDMESGKPFKVEIVKPVNPALVGYFKRAEGEKWDFAYALIQKDDNYLMYVKISDKYHGFVKARIEDDTIIFGKNGKGKIQYTKDGIIRTYDHGRFRTLMISSE